MGFRFGVGPTGGDTDRDVAAPSRLSVPYLSLILLTHITVEEWLRHSSGLGPSEVLVSAMLPESDEATNQIPIVAMIPPRHDTRRWADTTEL